MQWWFIGEKYMFLNSLIKDINFVEEVNIDVNLIGKQKLK
jgi:hypothetical protein